MPPSVGMHHSACAPVARQRPGCGALTAILATRAASDHDLWLMHRYMKLQTKAGALLASWFAHGQAKIALKVEDEERLVALKAAAQSAGLPVHVVVDAGRTQIAANTKTVLAILGPEGDVDAVTGSLKLL